MQRTLTFVTLLALLAGPSFTAAADTLAAVGEVERHMSTGDTAAILETIAMLEKSAPEPDADTLYALAYCRYRVASLSMADPSDKESANAASDMLKQAQAELEMVLEMVPEQSSRAVEAMSLLSGVMGTRIGLKPGLGMRLGAASGRHLAKAEALAPDNPRVHLQDGISKFNTPKMWGGSVRKAESSLRKAVALFAAQPSDTPWPNWGYVDALAWLGQSLAAQDKIDEARATYQQALALDPEMAWIRYELLPALDAK